VTTEVKIRDLGTVLGNGRSFAAGEIAKKAKCISEETLIALLLRSVGSSLLSFILA
jgi:hypothetical protein